MKSKMTLITALSVICYLLFATSISARVTPEDIYNSKLQAFNQKVANYSVANKSKLNSLSEMVDSINQTRSDYLAYIMDQQARVLNEYEQRTHGQDKVGIEKARYQITFAHEAVAYQAAKKYVFELSSEASIKNDAQRVINLFKSDLNSTRTKVINSQKVLQSVIKDAD